MLEAQSQAGVIDLFYGDESSVSEEGYVPYGWQFKDESVHIEAAKGPAAELLWADFAPESVALRDQQWPYSVSFCGQPVGRTVLAASQTNGHRTR
nr:hypothetical protein [Rudanella lutea]